MISRLAHRPFHTPNKHTPNQPSWSLDGAVYIYKNINKQHAEVETTMHADLKDQIIGNNER